ncbi:zinc finger X-chromosomal protein-like [Aphomia sociella]
MAAHELMLPESMHMLKHGIEIEISTSGDMSYNPLYDHDYITSPPKYNRKTVNKPKTTNSLVIYNCKICGYTTYSKAVMSKHSDTHKTIKPNTKYIPCTSCNVKKLPENYEKCSQCTYFTKNKSSLKVHEKIHNNGKAYKCTECQFSGADLKDLIKHYEHSKSLQCEYCDYSTHFKIRFLTHKRKHSVEKPFVCGVCFHMSADKSDLQEHIKLHHPEVN